MHALPYGNYTTTTAGAADEPRRSPPQRRGSRDECGRVGRTLAHGVIGAGPRLVLATRRPEKDAAGDAAFPPAFRHIPGKSPTCPASQRAARPPRHLHLPDEPCTVSLGGTVAVPGSHDPGGCDPLQYPRRKPETSEAPLYFNSSWNKPSGAQEFGTPWSQAQARANHQAILCDTSRARASSTPSPHQ